MGCFSVPKDGRGVLENQDWVVELVNRRGNGADRRRVIVVDGVTHGIGSGVFARGLAEHLLQLGSGRLREALQRACKLWKESVGSRPSEGALWLSEEALAQGGACTLVMVETFRKGRTFHALACGDACLFWTREGILEKAFPIETPEEFPEVPDSLRTKHIENGGDFQTLHLEGTFLPGRDTFYLMTDELARWTHRRLRAGDDPFAELRVNSASDFQKLIFRLRRERAVRNDDMSLCWIEP